MTITVLERMIAALARLNAAVCGAGRHVAAALLAVMTFAVLVQIVFRYVFNNSLSWSEELAKVMMVWATMLVAPWAYRMGANVSIDLFAEALPARLRAVLGFVLNLLVVWIVWIFLIESVALWQRGADTLSATLPVKMSVFYAILPLGFGGMLAVGVELSLRQIAQFLNPARSYAVPASHVPVADA
ncbi:MAG: TRAP transporter small permease [Rhodospirillaceae bacterium]|nr:TRAP transporter small permease [Rhodospirillaceae bacterium]